MNQKNIKENVKELASLIIIGIITFGILLQSPQNIWVRSDTGIDSSVFKYIGWAMTKGDVPYRDVFDHKGILIYILNTIGVWISKDIGVWLVEFVSMMIAAYVMYKIARLFTSRGWALLLLTIAMSPMIVYFEGGNLVEEYAMPYIAYALYCFMDFSLNNKITRIRLLLCGASLVAVLFLRPNMIVVWVVFCLAILVQMLKKKEFTRLIEFVVFFGVGILIVAIPVLLYLLINGAWKDFIYDYWIFNFAYVSDGNGSKWQALFHFANNTVIITAIVTVFYYFIKDRKIFDIIYGVCMLATLGSMALSGYTFAHYGMIMVPLLIYPFTKLLNDCKTKIIILVILIYTVIPSWFTYIETLDTKYKLRNTEQYEALTTDVCSYIQDNTKESDKIAVYGNWCIIYLQSNRMSATKYCYTISAKTDEYFAELDETKPVVIVMRNVSLDEKMNDWLEKNSYSLSYQVPDQALIYTR